MKTIELTKGKVAIVDDDCPDMILQNKWYATACKGGQYWYATRKVRLVRGNQRQHTQFMHRLIAEAPTGMCVDHINGDCLDNRLSNLRVCTYAENGQNRHRKTPGITSKHKGVSFCANHSTWRASINVFGTPTHLGSFKTEAEAAAAYEAASNRAFGAFARQATSEDIDAVKADWETRA